MSGPPPTAGAGSGDAPAPSSDASLEARLARLEVSLESMAREMLALRAAVAASPAGRAALVNAERVDEVRRDRVGSSTTAVPAPPVPSVASSPVPWPRGAGVGSSAAAPAAAPRRSRRPPLDLESLVGRYGTMALGALTIVLGVGAFVSWAVQRVTLGPEVRVGLGALGAAVLAVLGLWLRRRDRGVAGAAAGGSAGTRRFGDVLLALALAVVHVVAWGAGPSLHVVPLSVALGVAVLGSVLLALLAWREAQQALFVVGAGGALLAPFVTTDGRGDAALLLLYGLLVIGTTTAALRDRQWRWAQALLVGGVFLYTVAGLRGDWSGGLAAGSLWVRRDGPALFVLGCAAAALTFGGRALRSSFTRLCLLVLVLAIVGRSGRTAYPDLAVAATIGTAVLYLALRRPQDRQPMAIVSALLQPGLLLVAAFAVLPEPLGLAAAGAALVWAALAALAAADAWRTRAARDAEGDLAARLSGVVLAARRLDRVVPLPAAHLLVAGLATLLAVGLALRDRPLMAASALALCGVLGALLVRRVRHPILLAIPLVALVTAGGWIVERLEARVAYEYAPFLTPESAAALVVVASAWAMGLVLRDALEPDIAGVTERAILGAIGAAAAFLWAQVELARAFSPERAAFLLIVFYAAAGVILIFLGRRRGIPGGRRIGLVLAVLAAIKAIVQSSELTTIGLRVGAFLVVGGFLMAVAYWYRAAGEPGGAEGGAAGPTADAGD